MKENVSSNAVIFHFYIEASEPFIKNLGEHKLLNSNRLISETLRVALEIEAPANKTSGLSHFLSAFRRFGDKYLLGRT